MFDAEFPNAHAAWHAIVIACPKLGDFPGQSDRNLDLISGLVRRLQYKWEVDSVPDARFKDDPVNGVTCYVESGTLLICQKTATGLRVVLNT